MLVTKKDRYKNIKLGLSFSFSWRQTFSCLFGVANHSGILDVGCDGSQKCFGVNSKDNLFFYLVREVNLYKVPFGFLV